MKTVNLVMEKGRGEDCGVLVLEGALSLDCVGEIQQFLVEAAGRYRDLEVRVRSVESLDLGFLQLLHGLSVRQREKGGTLQVDMALEKEMRQLLGATGFSRWLGESQI